MNILLEKYSYEGLNKYSRGVWENFVVIEKLKDNTLLNNRNKLYYWRNRSESEVDLVEKVEEGIMAYEIKHSDKRKVRLPPTFIDITKPRDFNVVNLSNYWKLYID